MVCRVSRASKVRVRGSAGLQGNQVFHGDHSHSHACCGLETGVGVGFVSLSEHDAGLVILKLATVFHDFLLRRISVRLSLGMDVGLAAVVMWWDVRGTQNKGLGGHAFYM